MIRKANLSDRTGYIEMVSEFYSSDAVMHSIPKSNMENTFDEVMKSGVYADIYIAEIDKKYAGYALTAKTYSQEAGGIVVWIEEIYIRSDFRGKGIGRELIAFIESDVNTAARFRLEAETENKGAISLYERLGYGKMPYVSMYKETNYE